MGRNGNRKRSRPRRPAQKKKKKVQSQSNKQSSQKQSTCDTNNTTSAKATKWRPSVGVIIGMLGVIVAVVGVGVPIQIDKKAQDREIANLKHYLLIQPVGGLRDDGTADRWAAMLGTANFGPAAVEHAKTYIGLVPSKSRIVSLPQILNRPPLTKIEIVNDGIPREVSYAFENLAPASGFIIRLEFELPEDRRDKVKFGLMDPNLVKNFIQLVGTNGEKINVDYTSMSAQPIPNLEDLEID